MPDFLVKLPMFRLDGGRRGLMVTAKVQPNRVDADVTLYCDDNQTISVRMPAARVLAAAKNGPFVALAEVKDIGNDIRGGVGIVGPDGLPIKG
jgi:hypothetical protein